METQGEEIKVGDEVIINENAISSFKPNTKAIVTMIDGCERCSYNVIVTNCDGWLEKKEFPSSIPAKGWSIDCLPCGYLRLFSKIHNGLKFGWALSNFSVFADFSATKKEDEE